MLEMGLDLIRGRYPRFVYGLERGRQEAPPVLCFHDAQPRALEALLRFLSDNGYQTLDCDAFLDHLNGERPAPRRCVLLTFDDGLGSMWSVAYPLLKQYGHRVAVFLIPGRMRDAAPGPNLDDVRAGRASLAEVEQRDRSEHPLLSWREAALMHQSGHFDFQSHSLHHQLVITACRVSGFVTPQLLATAHPHDLTLYEIDPGAHSYALPRLGAPLYPASPRLSAALQLREDTGLRVRLEEHVEHNGGEAFFRRPDWRERLQRIVRSHQSASPPQAESPAEMRRALFADLAQSKRLIEEHLPGKQVRHLAFPWGVGSDEAVAAARRAGYASCHWGRVDGRVANRVGTDPYRIARVGGDFAPLLPGQGRSALPTILWRKLNRRSTRGTEQEAAAP